MNTHGWYSLVDWSLSGVGRMVEALHAVDKPRSENMAKRGLTELLQSPENTLAYRLSNLALRLETMVGVLAVNAKERSKATNKLQVTPLPDGLSGTTVEALMNLKRRTAMITEVFVIDIERDRSEVIALSPDTARVIVVK